MQQRTQHAAWGGTRPSRPAESRIRTLLLSLTYPNRVSYYDDWREMFTGNPAFECQELNILNLTPAALARAIDHDAIVLLHSCNSDTLDYLAPLVPVLADRRRGKLISFVGNEYNSPYVSTEWRTELLGAARCDIIATQLLEEAGTYLYASTGARIASIPHALNPVSFQAGPPSGERSRDIGVRGYKYPPFLGDEERNTFITALGAACPRHGLAADIGEDKRLGRDKWAAFLGDCRGTVSTEAGSWYISPNDALMGEISAFLAERRTGLVIRNDSLLRRIARRLPSGIKAVLWAAAKHGPVKFEVIDDLAVPFAEFEQRFFTAAARAPVYGKAITSRHFDAIGTHTCQILLEGRYNDILRPGEHYIPVRRDLSDLDAALCRFKDDGERLRLTRAAHELAMDAHTYAHRAAEVARLLEGG